MNLTLLTPDGNGTPIGQYTVDASPGPFGGPMWATGFGCRLYYTGSVWRVESSTGSFGALEGGGPDSNHPTGPYTGVGPDWYGDYEVSAA